MHHIFAAFWHFSDIQALGPAPDGGLQAWLVAAGGFCIFFCCLGFTSCFGVLQEYYSTHQLRERSTDDVAWIGSLSSFIQFAGGAIGGPTVDRYGAGYYQFMLAQGVLMGAAVAFLQFPAFAIVSQYFDKKRAAAIGIVVCGSSIGGVVFPIILSKMLNDSNIGFGWTIRIIAFILLPFMLFACVVIKPRVPSRQATFFIGAAWKQRKYVLLVAALFFMMMGMWTPIFYMPTYAVSRGMGVSLAANLLAIINASSTFGRIIPGFLADRLGRLNTFAFAGVSSGVIIFCINETTTNASIIVYAVFFGFCSGTIVSSASAAISLCTNDPRDIGTYIGMGMGLSAFAVLVGPPINGALIDKYGGFLQASIFSGVVCLFGGLIAFSSKLATSEGIFGKV
ncbi:MFS general substrate transporter [Dothidotthia symphoricarpi CBS 119687]|uniref:MFS general substrate transporter n=1 Tax=Dothidotthia symphoricarpi CBS 119687 TaxID=1392245 RepID=A0A6A6AC64_9PLEO|nr:MFS general substrate transporter [Dothidotthia symphoricarpi CBS 119687]KAF2129409.1 MFS general substrate transporter [Dothidotthia symphoricarpi CBS 119687]